jgi:hypothetical protein
LHFLDRSPFSRRTVMDAGRAPDQRSVALQLAGTEAGLTIR